MMMPLVGVAGDGVGNATGATIGANVTNVEKLLLQTTAADNNAGDVDCYYSSGLQVLH